MRVHLKTLGCRLNEAELESWSHDFRALGHQVTQQLGEADLVVVNTCAVTAEAVRKSRKLLHRAQRDNPAAKLVVSGCYATLGGPQELQNQGVDLLVNNQEKDRLVEITCRELDIHAMPAQAANPGQHSLLGQGRHRAFIKVQDGCRYRCTFCIVTVARGEERSRPIPQVIAEINAHAEQGIQEVILTGVHIGGYGSDTGTNLYRLVQAVLEQTDIPRLRLGAVEPWDLPNNFWGLFANPRFLPHLHLPLQSGADSVLKRMARRCKKAEFERLAGQARAAIPEFNLTTDIIVGFPGETEDEWRESIDFVEQIGFGHLHIFAYSARPGTRAATLPNPIPREIIRARSEQIHRLGSRMKRALLQHHLGRSYPVLIEGWKSTPAPHWTGYTPNFLRVEIPEQLEADLENSIRPVRLERLSASGEILIATLNQE